jgi:hypothetical protein
MILDSIFSSASLSCGTQDVEPADSLARQKESTERRPILPLATHSTVELPNGCVGIHLNNYHKIT